MSGICLLISVLANSWIVGFLARPDFYGGLLLTLLMATGLLTVAVAEHLGSLFYCAGKAKLVSLVLALEVILTFLIAAFLCGRHGLLGVATTIALMPALVRIPYYIRQAPAACSSTCWALYGPAMTGAFAVLLCGWGNWILASGMERQLSISFGGSAIFAGLLCTVLSFRSGWRAWLCYRKL